MRRPATPVDYWLFGVRLWCRALAAQADWWARMRARGVRAGRGGPPGRSGSRPARSPQGSPASPLPARRRT